MAGRVQTYTDPLQHALIAAAVVAPLGRRAIPTAVVVALAIDVDHAVAARSVRVRHTTRLSLFWPFAPARQLGRRRQHIGTTALALASVAIRRATAAGSASSDGGGAAARPRTA